MFVEITDFRLVNLHNTRRRVLCGQSEQFVNVLHLVTIGYEIANKGGYYYKCGVN
jgi:hypothetical protein